ncbi:glycosyltransferase [Robertkochia solimangrovi]|uniref:glycosyltransferase n=1 Tax=Robertkochia solimangrovi TaxID=2213046 RepID=UPI001180BAC0|nr:glycosyltransferase [Robertkochia solimangrovi]TRZ41079.1 glycosyl transferase family 2 [Robertkochia solimangrovi]
MELDFSFIIPVYNRPDEIGELLASMSVMDGGRDFEIVIVEDGSEVTAEQVVKDFSENLNISYYQKANSGPGDSRNYGMSRAKGNYFIILDSDCLLPPHYLNEVKRALQQAYVDCYGGPDAAHESFSTLQKAINYTMTSIFTTGGIRGNKRSVGKFQPRSFNMGLSRKAFERSGGFGDIHPGEDPDLTLRLWKNGFETRLLPEAYVYHKRRISWKLFYKQVRKFGLTRPILNRWHPESKKITYWFPTLFITGMLVSLILCLVGFPYLLYLYLVYLLMIFAGAWYSEGSLLVACYSVLAILIQFIGYGIAFAKSELFINLLRRNPREVFPELFFS